LSRRGTRHDGMEGADVSHLEAIGALNFLDLADIPLLEEGN
jgi:hypothetical protein